MCESTSASSDGSTATTPPLVSVIMPTRGRPELIRVAIQSVLAQSHENWELIVINDGGPDIGATIDELNRSGRIVYTRLPRPRGAAGARNAGLAVARGTYVAYLDDDDWFDESHLALLVGALENGTCRVAYTDSRRIVEEKRDGVFRPAGVQDPYHAVPFSRDALLVNNYIPILAIAHRRDLMDEVGGFDETLEVLEDWELWIRMSRKHDFVRVPQVTCNVRWRQDGSTTTTGRQRDHHPCAQRIYERHAEPTLVGLAEARARLLGCLEPAFRNTAPTVSIVVPVADGAAQLRACLSAIASTTRGLSYEVVVVANGSSEATANVALASRLETKVVVLPNRVSLGEALQRGAQQARGELLVFMSADHIVREHCVRALVEDAQQHPGAAVVCAKVLDVCGTVADAGWSLGDAEPRAQHVGARAWDAAVSERARVRGASSLMLMRRSVFERTTGFDPRFETMFALSELSWRAREHGEVVLQPTSVAYVTVRAEPAATARDVAQLSADSARPRDVAVMVREAKEAMGAGDFDRAAAIVAELERAAPDAGDTQLTRGVFQLQLGHNDEAVASFTAALTRGADTQRASLGVAMALMASARHDEAWEVLQALAVRHPDASQVAHMLFRVGALLERWPDLIDHLEHYLSFAERDLAIRFATASVCVRHGDFTRARRHYDALRFADPGYRGLQDLASELTAHA